MDVNRLPPNNPSQQGVPAAQVPVIALKQIKTILYMGLRGQVPLPGAAGEHLIDTFA